MTTAALDHVDASVQPFFRSNREIREFLAPGFRTRGIPDVEVPWYQAPGGSYHEDLVGDGYPASDPERVSHDLFEVGGATAAVLNPLTRGNLPDYLLNDAICGATNEWLATRWLDEGNPHGRFRGTIRVNPEHVVGAVAEIDRWAGHELMVQVGVPLQSREPYGKPQFVPIWEAAAAHGLPVAVHLTGGAGIEYPPTPVGHVRTYAHYQSYMPLNYFHHLSTLLVEGVFERVPNLKFIFGDGGADVLTPLVWRLDTLWRAFRDQTPWVPQIPSEYLRGHVRFCWNRLEGPFGADFSAGWFEQLHKDDLLMFASSYPYWMLARPEDLPAGLSDEQRDKILRRNAADLYGLAPVEADDGGGRDG